ncbi:MAG: hypothetical protein FJ304_13390 [Planctomycetes bacterium]|nr:hypothetical protein [Planctomycetota bacterium]
MRPVFALALLTGLALAGATTADEKDDKALKELEGTYLLVGLEGKGLKLTEEDFMKVEDGDRKIVIKGGQIVAFQKGKEDPAKLKIDVSKTPAHIDITSTKDKKDEVNYGTYKFEKVKMKDKDDKEIVVEVLTICAVEMGDAKDRPKEFKVNDKELLIVLHKQK